VLSASRSTPIRVGNVAEFSAGYAPRLGIVGRNNQNDIVEGIVLMRKYGNTLRTLAGVKKKVAGLNRDGVMPKGYAIVPYYDRTKLVDTTLNTVKENLAIGIALVFVVLLFFIGNLRTALITAINIPLALLGAFTVMHLSNTPANLISLGAIDFGIIIDSSVIVMENIFRHLNAVPRWQSGGNSNHRSRFMPGSDRAYTSSRGSHSEFGYFAQIMLFPCLLLTATAVSPVEFELVGTSSRLLCSLAFVLPIVRIGQHDHFDTDVK
jgi:Cu/Ag efflux pump CusA